MIEIVRIGLFDIDQNFQREFEFEGKQFRIRSYGTNGDVSLLLELVEKFDGDCDYICLSNLPNSVKVKGIDYAHPLVTKIKDSVKFTPILDGKKLREIYFPWSIRRIAEDFPEVLKNKKIGFPSGLVHYNFINDIAEHSDHLVFADPYFLLGAPTVLTSKKSLERFTKVSFPFIKRSVSKKMTVRDFTLKKLSSNPFLKKLAMCEVFFCNQTQFDYLEFDNLQDKIIITDFMNKKLEKKLKDSGTKGIISCFPEIPNLPCYGFTILEAVISAIETKDDEELKSINIFNFINRHNLTPSFTKTSIDLKDDMKRKCAFVIHPLSKKHLVSVPGISLLKNNNTLVNFIEKSATILPGIPFGNVRGIKSDYSGVEVECDMYAVLQTPKMLLSGDKNKIYDKLVGVAKKAQQTDCKLMGLGAYTKIVGDAGVTVNDRSPLPVTTGNSLSAAATLWAADFAIAKMELIKKIDGQYNGSVMIVGATGSIGKVCAKVLCQSWDKLIISAPREYKLMDLQKELSELNPKCQVEYTTSSADYSSECDLIITTTSAQGKKVLEIADVKPGCVICDVSRPFDISKEDAISRPDVLVIASGEVELPGDSVTVNRDIGLSGATVYACLAETVLLTLEGRYESFSISRDLDYKKVKEIDRMARKHGVKLSAIMGHDEEITLSEIQMCKERALAKLQSS